MFSDIYATIRITAREFTKTNYNPTSKSIRKLWWKLHLRTSCSLLFSQRLIYSFAYCQSSVFNSPAWRQSKFLCPTNNRDSQLLAAFHIHISKVTHNDHPIYTTRIFVSACAVAVMTWIASLKPILKHDSAGKLMVLNHPWCFKTTFQTLMVVGSPANRQCARACTTGVVVVGNTIFTNIIEEIRFNKFTAQTHCGCHKYVHRDEHRARRGKYNI